MSIIDAVYQDGVFKPLGDVTLRENQRVRLRVEPVVAGTVGAWLDDLRRLQQDILDRHGLLPDSTPDISADRMRDA
jgi:predicted DNA-binding antitoxin AbrB/MazE fold protein